MNPSQVMKAQAVKAVALQLGFKSVSLSLDAPTLPVVPASTLTNTEVFKLYGHLPAARIEALLENDRSLEKITDLAIEGSLEDAQTKFPDPDFATTILNDMRDLAKRVRGANQQTLEGIITDLVAKQKEVHDTALEGVAILENIIKEMNAL